MVGAEECEPRAEDAPIDGDDGDATCATTTGAVHGPLVAGVKMKLERSSSLLVRASSSSPRIFPGRDDGRGWHTSSAMGDDGWRRATLSYREKFVDDYELRVPGAPDDAPPLRIAQAPSASAAHSRIQGNKVGTARAAAGREASTSAAPPPEDDDADPVPATGFTIWDAGILLGAYVAQPRVWRRLVGDAAADARTAVVLELGAGTGVAGLTLAASAVRPAVVALTDLPGLVPFLRHNAARNKAPAGPVSPEVALAVCPLRWGRPEDLERLPPALRTPSLVLGADLVYTEKTEVIDALIDTLASIVPVGGVAAIASCRDHRPESVERFERGCRERGFDVRKVLADELREGFGRGGDEDAFRVLEMRRVRV